MWGGNGYLHTADYVKLTPLSTVHIRVIGREGSEHVREEDRSLMVSAACIDDTSVYYTELEHRVG